MSGGRWLLTRPTGTSGRPAERSWCPVMVPLGERWTLDRRLAMNREAHDPVVSVMLAVSDASAMRPLTAVAITRSEKSGALHCFNVA